MNTYIIAEIGPNHNGKVETALKMIDKLAGIGVDAVKFQLTIPENLFSLDSFKPKYQRKNVKNCSPIEMSKKNQLSTDNHILLYQACQKVGVDYLCSAFDIESLKFIDSKFDLNYFKIASGDMTDIPLIRHVAKMDKPMIISTGLANMDEVEIAVNTCLDEGNKKIILLHCIAHYPTEPNETNLFAMETIRNKFHLPVGYSDNGESLLVDIVAVSMGANIIEKHFTLDKKLPGPDHFFSIDPSGLKNLISQIQTVESMKGDGIKSPQSSEIPLITETRKSITASMDIQKDEILTKEKLLTKRPATGIEPKYLDQILGKKLNRSIKQDTAIVWEDIE